MIFSILLFNAIVIFIKLPKLIIVIAFCIIIIIFGVFGYLFAGSWGIIKGIGFRIIMIAILRLLVSFMMMNGSIWLGVHVFNFVESGI